jgi:hypothetical protein
LERIAGVLGSVWARAVLSMAIIISLLPFEWATRLDPFFLILFGVEFVLRATLLFRGESIHVDATLYRHRRDPLHEHEPAQGWRWPRLGQLMLLFFDLLALVSFVPIQADSAAGTRWLRMFRLSRMLLLFSYWSPMVRDTRAVLLRGERAKHVALMGFVVLAWSFTGAVVIEHVASESGPVDFDGDNQLDADDRRFFVHLWWAFRQLQDPGNMLAQPGEAVVVVVSLVLTTLGLFMVSFLIGLGTDVVRELLELTRLRPPGLRGHTVVVNIDPSTQQLLHMLMRYSKKLKPSGRFSLGWIRKLLRNTTERGLGAARFVVVGDNHDPPDFMRQPDLLGIVYRQAPVGDDSFLVRTDTVAAHRVVLLADLTAKDPDAQTIQALLTITQSLVETDERREHSARKRLLIAEILDESNVPAARRAIVEGTGPGGSQQTRAFVIPTERLIALFIACITRRPGCESLLEELLTSRGHELYTCFFDEKGLGYCEDRRPPLPRQAGAIMAELRARARALPAEHRVIPVGLFHDPKEPGDDPCVDINPALEPAPEGEPSEAAADCGCTCAGFIAIASNFFRVRALSESLFSGPITPTNPAGEAGCELPGFASAKTTPLDRLLICGFRSGTVSMVESLIQANPSTQILIMFSDDHARVQALDDFEAHSRLVERELLRGNHGRFRAADGQSLLHWHHPGDDQAERGHVYLAVGDWSSSRKLASLPFGFGSVAELDAVILVSCERTDSDARTAKTLMKLETLVSGERAPRVVAEVFDVDFARRLRERSRKHAGNRSVVYSIQELRAFFMFQAVVVPAFDQVYAELMGPWGQSFIKLDVARAGQGRCRFETLADPIAGEGRLLVAVELAPRAGRNQPVLCVADGDPDDPEGKIDLARLTAVWVIADEGPGTTQPVCG